MDLFRIFGNGKAKASNVLTDFTRLREMGIKIKPLAKKDVEEIFPHNSGEVFHSFQTVDLGKSLVSVLRLTKQSEFGMDLTTLSHIKDLLPLPYTICCSVQTVSPLEAEGFLRRRSKQNALSSDLNESRKLEEAQADLEDVSLNGSKLFRFEWQCLVERDSEERLRQDRELITRTLEPIGEIYIESVGAVQSLRSFFVGEPPHYTLLEKDQTLVTYLPLVSRGEVKAQKTFGKSALALHRRDEGLTYINVFDPRYESFSWCVFGRPGTGKSVFVNAFTRALVNDQKIKVIKIDVGGSHSRETLSLGGVERTLCLNEPTGINPFDVIHHLGPTREAIQILASFLEVLILEEGETKLSKTMKSDLERAVHAYAEAELEKCSLQDFFDTTAELPRRELLARWVGKGVYGNSFKVVPLDDIGSNPQLLYYNFSKISQALDPDYAQGGLAAVMAQFNLEMLKKSASKNKIVFIADETPFFIKKCFSFFNLSIANVRKEGHGFITVAQKSAHVVVDGDTGILDNSPNRIYFSVDGDNESFAARNQLSKDTALKINSLRREQGVFSECLLKDNLGERVLRVKLDPVEYWSYTSKDEDRQKFRELQAACPSLSQREILQCLSYC